MNNKNVRFASTGLADNGMAATKHRKFQSLRERISFRFSKRKKDFLAD